MTKASFDDEVRSLHRQLLDAWNQRDAAAIASLFAGDGNMVGFDGSKQRRRLKKQSGNRCRRLVFLRVSADMPISRLSIVYAAS